MATRKASRRLSSSLIEAIKEEGFDSPEDMLLVTPIRYQRQEPPYNLIDSRKSLLPGVVKVFSKVALPAEQISTFPSLIKLQIQSRDKAIAVLVNGLLDALPDLLRLKQDDEVIISGVLSSDGQYIYNGQLVGREPLLAVYKAKSKGFSKTIPAYMNHSFLNLLKKAESGIHVIFQDISKEELIDYLNFGFKEKTFSSIKQFLFSLHFPFTDDEAENAKRAAANIASLDCCIRAKKASVRPNIQASVISISPETMSTLISRLPFAVTKEQKKAMAETWRDLCSPFPMNRLISGDVGTGKTAVIGVIAAAAHLASKRVAIFTPNGLLTDQLHKEMCSWFPELPIIKVTKDEKPDKATLARNPVLVGTHAVINWATANGFIPDLMIIDEQQKSSRAQRETLLHEHTNLLEATATALPRTFGLMLYGGMKISVIKQQPVVKKIITQVVYESEKSVVFAHIKQTITSGAKVAVILPLVLNKTPAGEEIDADKDKLAVESALPLWEAAFPGKVIALHGKMSEDEKIRRLTEARDTKDKPIIIATSLIEIGVTIKDLRHLVVIEADRYGISTLHQMRGRLARNGGDGFMHLLLKKPPEEVKQATMDRLQALEKTTCGFELSEIDAKNRGWGDLAEDSSLQAGEIVTLFKNILIPHETISSIQEKFQESDGQISA